MRVRIPLLVQSRREPNEPGSMFHVRPLFFDWPQASDRILSKATAKGVSEIRRYLNLLGQEGKMRELAAFCYAPEFTLEIQKLRLDLQQQSFLGQFPLVLLRGLDRRLGFCPLIENFWFELERGEATAPRSLEVLTRYFRRLEKEDEELAAALLPFTLKSQLWHHEVELDIHVVPRRKGALEEDRAILGGSQVFDGETELRSVGRCLDWLYPDRLQRALYRKGLMEQLQRLLSAGDNRPVLLTGPRQVGKTTLLHEYVYRQVQKRGGPYKGKRHTWLLSPQRLISGMSYVGQWEERLLAILKAASRHGHLLYFDDLLGLYRAGVSSSSSHSAAHVLKPFLQKREIRVVAEATPDQLRKLREQDRSLADLFHILPVEEPQPKAMWRMLIAAVRHWEELHHCRFDLEVLPTVVDLTQRYGGQTAMPGKAAVQLARLAAKHPALAISRQSVLDDFHATSGIDLAVLDTRVRLPRNDIVKALEQSIFGQSEALAALADVVSIAKARLNDRSRPLGSLLFLGTTGVGKTQSAKALAEFLFGHADRLLRFDMNEFVSPNSAARLIGTFHNPEGLLTSAVRRQPFSVILLDEIEKADPGVFDLLLQLLGEGRLTDGLGRTADFTNSVIILTSNLGTDRGGAIGFHADAAGQRAELVAAAEQFFRPEFFNRLDRIIAFAQLGREELGRIARTVLEELLSREGLRRRKAALAVDENVVQWVIEQGCRPELGARAMRRAVERLVVRPLAGQLAGIAPETPTVLEISRYGEGVHIHVQPLENAKPDPAAFRPHPLPMPQEVLDRVEHAINLYEQRARKFKPAGGWSAGGFTSEQVEYLAVTELLGDVRAEHRRIAEAVAQAAASHSLPSIAPRGPRVRFWRCEAEPGRVLREIISAHDIHDYFEEIANSAAPAYGAEKLPEELHRLIDRTSLLALLAPGEEGWRPQAGLLLVRALGPHWRQRAEQTGRRLCEKFCFFAGVRDVSFNPYEHENELPTLGPTTEWIESDEVLNRWQCQAWTIQGQRAIDLFRIEQGTHLYTTSDGAIVPVQVLVLPAKADETLEECRQRIGGQLAESITAKSQEGSSNPFLFQPIVRLVRAPHNGWIDLRTGLTARFGSLAGEVDLLLHSLPLPAELQF